MAEIMAILRSRLSDERQEVLRRIERQGGELSVDYAPKGRSVWRAKFHDSGGVFNIYESRQDHISLEWLYEIGRAERLPWALDAHAAAMAIVAHETA